MTFRASRIRPAPAQRSLRALFGDDSAFCRILVILADEVVVSGIERADVDNALRLAGDHLFNFQGGRIELLRKRIGVDDRQRNPLAGRHAQFGWLETMIANGNRRRIRLFGSRGRA